MRRIVRIGPSQSIFTPGLANPDHLEKTVIRRTIGMACGLALISVTAYTQQPAAMNFRLSAVDKNPSGCKSADTSLSRQQTVTIAGDTAVLKSNGGINDKAKQTSPGVYKTKWSANGTTYDIEVNTTTSPKTLVVAEVKMGCKWMGSAP